jgi:hypothetical protein
VKAGWTTAALAAVCGLGAACSTEQPAGERGSGDDPLAVLRAFDAERRAATDFAKLPPSDQATGADPYRIVASPAGSGYVAILRGRDALVLLDERLAEVARAPAPASPSGLTVAPDGAIWVVGEGSSMLSRYRISGGALQIDGAVDLGDVRAARDVAAGPGGAIYVVEEHDDRLLIVYPEQAKRSELRLDAGPFRLARVGDWLLVACLLDHTLLAYPLDRAGAPLEAGVVRVHHDGPIWGFDAVVVPDGLLVAAAGVEDHPLDRRGGSFGYVDSFVYLVLVSGGQARRIAEINVSAHGVVTPKAVRLEAGARDGVRLLATGYGGDHAAVLRWSGSTPADLAAEPRVTTFDLPPGTAALSTSAGRMVAANPLLDAWIGFGQDGGWAAVPVADVGHPRDPAARLGEALFFTTRMAPHNDWRGELSRFTCETCHFEGYVDGRTHHTGRDDIRATTKPLLGLFNNRPHFSRALDQDLVAVAHNEFAVAGKRSGKGPWFALTERDAPWLSLLAEGGAFAERSPLELRRSLMAFLMELSHRSNPRARDQREWTPTARAGAQVFRDRCEGCHAARLSSDDPGSVVPFEQWEALTLSREGPIVWGRAGYEKTGILPYVHADGARVPSLRRLYKKRPYFTNGTARTLDEVLGRVRWTDAGFSHAGEGGDAAKALSAADRASLLAFLDLL